MKRPKGGVASDSEYAEYLRSVGVLRAARRFVDYSDGRATHDGGYAGALRDLVAATHPEVERLTEQLAESNEDAAGMLDECERVESIAMACAFDAERLRLENTHWRKATGWDDPGELDLNLGRAGIDHHLNALNGLRLEISRERDSLRQQLTQSEAALVKKAAELMEAKERAELFAAGARNAEARLDEAKEAQFEHLKTCASVRGRQEIVRSLSFVDAHTANAAADALGTILDEESFPLGLRERAAEALLVLLREMGERRG